MKTTIPFVLIAVALLCPAAAIPNAQAVNPPPDGGYPGFNTAEGTNALFSLTTGSLNTAVGWSSLFSDAEGSLNTAAGAGALIFNTADQNTAFGAAALLLNTTAEHNTAIGAAALLNNTTGGVNTATGAFALSSNTTGEANTAIGDSALSSNSTGNGNTATGQFTLAFNDVGSDNTAIGNTALSNNTTGVGNTALGAGAGGSVTTASNVICIGAAGENVDNSCYIGNIYNQATGGLTVVVGSNNRLGTLSSSKRFKQDIKPMDNASEVLFGLTPVTFRYKKDIDAQSISQFGLVAEEVEKIDHNLVVRDQEGKPYTVRYDAVNAMLLNEFLKEHRKVQQQEDRIVKLEGTVDALTAELREQAAQVQKVSSQIEFSRPSARTVLNDR